MSIKIELFGGEDTFLKPVVVVTKCAYNSCVVARLYRLLRLQVGHDIITLNNKAVV